jgi:Flp pilus assembly protein TadB
VAAVSDEPDRPAMEDEPGYPSTGTDPDEASSSEKGKGKGRPGCFAVSAALVVLVGLVAFLTMLGMLIWPGEAKLTAPQLCPDGKSDAFVVKDEYETSEGTSIDFSLYCMGPRGETEEIGWARPWLVLTIGHVVLSVGLIVLLYVTAVVVGATRRRRRKRREREAEHGPHMVIS